MPRKPRHHPDPLPEVEPADPMANTRAACDAQTHRLQRIHRQGLDADTITREALDAIDVIRQATGAPHAPHHD